MNPFHQLRITLLHTETEANPVNKEGVRLKMNNLNINQLIDVSDGMTYQ